MQAAIVPAVVAYRICEDLGYPKTWVTQLTEATYDSDSDGDTGGLFE